ncbi:helix-turn-helix domain-containing protein [Hyunsoonleella sp. SJ7]|uniref:Helix-turn-helix domain-containing protein n=1 Tax=Hyunsoonleella aquatilis TaxID=2762758 RepID=A0A923KL71_9FLAO|nr:helix-turn-helix domain-containing protein [Hyunsoonleella aquatilis]MBC3758558.1 helix-turn-helix domain-containing protein [Hyunsoonleella aquatilis]
MSDQNSLDESFLKKVEDVIEANLENEQFGVNELSDTLGMSRSKLHRKLNALTGKSTSQFIREYRLEKAMVMLQDNEATASEIAYRVGFSSPTYFNTRFSEYFGYPPGEVKYRSSSSSRQADLKGSKYQKGRTPKSSRQKNIVIALLSLILMIALAYFVFNWPKENGNDTLGIAEKMDKSIAVLPFKNLSDDKDNQYFADGVREDIINQLSKIGSVSVKSKQSSDRFYGDNLSGEEMGEALNVDYLINGSVQKHQDRIRIIVHLVNAKDDTHLWSKDFDREFEDIFNLEKEISTDIAKELDIVLSPSELDRIGRIPTQNLEAYNLYLKGRHFLYQFDQEDFKRAERYFNQSIALDPLFALPYSGLAEVIMFRNWPRVPKDDYLKAKKYALRAIELDDELSYPHRVLANISLEYEWNWEESNKEFQIALEKEPDNAVIYWLYARNFMFVNGDFDKGLDYADKAIQLNPVFLYSHILKAECYLYLKEYDLALQEANKAIEINERDLWASWIIFLANVEQGKNDLAVQELERGWRLDPAGQVNVEPMLKVYKKDGIQGIFRWLNDLDINHEGEDHVYHSAYWIAQKFAFLGEHDKALEWLEIAFERRNAELYRIKYDHFFKGMQEHPKFLSILNRMNLGDYGHERPFKD